MKRILAMLLSVICVLSFTCVSTYADEKSEDEEKAASIAESYLSAAAKNMWLYESNNLAEHTIQELVDPSGNSLLSDMSADVNTQKILSSMDNITFVQEKSKYFREMRQRQDIQRNDFALEYTVTSASIEDNISCLLSLCNSPQISFCDSSAAFYSIGKKLSSIQFRKTHRQSL